MAQDRYAELLTGFNPLPRGVWLAPWYFGPGRFHYLVAVDSSGLAIDYGEFHDADSFEAVDVRLTRLLEERDPPIRHLRVG